MPALRPAFLLLLSLHAGVPALAQPPSEPWEPGVRHLDLSASAAAQVVPELHMTPGLALTLVFDTPLHPARQSGVRMEGREHFQIVSLDEEGRVLTLVPSREVKPGRRLRLWVHFADGGVPASAEFVLVAHPAQAETHVQVYRQPRSAETCCQEAREERHQRQQCEVSLARTRAECSGKGGLIGLAAEGLLMRAAGEEPEGVRAHQILEKLTRARDNALKVKDAVTLRTAAASPEGEEERVRVAVQLKLESLDAQDWKAEGAQLTAPGGVRPNVTLWQSSPLKPGTWEVMVEAEMTKEQARGRFTLKLWDASGARTLSVGGVTFP
jgi:uncharacterized protein (TIGR02268 family)